MICRPDPFSVSCCSDGLLRLISPDLDLFRVSYQARLNQVNIPRYLLLNFILISGDFIVPEDANEQVKRVKVLFTLEAILAAFRPLLELVE